MTNLPDDEIAILNRLQAVGDTTNLKRRLASLHEAEWSLRELAAAVSVSHTTIAKWVAESEPAGIAPSPLRVIEFAGDRTERWSVQLSPTDQQDIAQYAANARKVTAKTPPEAGIYRDGVKLDHLIRYHLEERMVPVTEIARVMGVTHRAVRARLERRYGRN